MKMQWGQTILVIALLLFAGMALVFPITEKQAEPISTPMQAHLSAGGLEYYLLSQKFGDDISSWTEEQKEVAWSLLFCVEEWWAVATEDQKAHTGQFMPILLCWERIEP